MGKIVPLFSSFIGMALSLNNQRKLICHKIKKPTLLSLKSVLCAPTKCHSCSGFDTRARWWHEHYCPNNQTSSWRMKTCFICHTRIKFRGNVRYKVTLLFTIFSSNFSSEVILEGRGHARINSCVAVTKMFGLASIPHFEMPQVLRNKVTPAKQVSLGGKIPLGISLITPTWRERQVALESHKRQARGIKVLFFIPLV